MKFLGNNNLPPPTGDEGLFWATAAPLTNNRNTNVSTRFMQAPGNRGLIPVLGKRTELGRCNRVPADPTQLEERAILSWRVRNAIGRECGPFGGNSEVCDCHGENFVV